MGSRESRRCWGNSFNSAEWTRGTRFWCNASPCVAGGFPSFNYSRLVSTSRRSGNLNAECVDTSRHDWFPLTWYTSERWLAEYFQKFPSYQRQYQQRQTLGSLDWTKYVNSPMKRFRISGTFYDTRSIWIEWSMGPRMTNRYIPQPECRLIVKFSDT